MQSTKCLWLSGFNEKTRLKDIERELRHILRVDNLDKVKILIESFDNNKKDELEPSANLTNSYALVSFDSLRHSETSRNELRSSQLPNGMSDKLRCDYFEPNKFKKMYNSKHKISSLSSSASNNGSETSQENSQSNSNKRKSSRSRSVESRSRDTTSQKRDDETNETLHIEEETKDHKRQKSRSKSPIIKSENTRIIVQESNNTSLSNPSNSISTTNATTNYAPVFSDTQKPSNKKSKFENIIITTSSSGGEDSRRVIKTSTTPNNTLSKVKSRSSRSSSRSSSRNSSQDSKAVQNQQITSNNGDTLIISTDVDMNDVADTGSIKNNKTVTPPLREQKKPAKNEPKSSTDRNGQKNSEDLADIDSDNQKQPTVQSVVVQKTTPPPTQVKYSILHFMNKSLLHKEKNRDVRSILDIKKYVDPSWCGLFRLKRESFPNKFYFLTGSRDLNEKLLTKSLNQLRINQRTRLEPNKVDDFEKKVYVTSKTNDEPVFSILVGLPSESSSFSKEYSDQIEDMGKLSPMHNLIDYLDQKGAAGVIPLPDDKKMQANLNIFTPNSPFVQKLLKNVLPNLSSLNDVNNKKDDGEIVDDVEQNYLILILLRANTTTNNN